MRRTVEVWRTEEKGSDVNLATNLLVDAFRGEYETAVVISNDSDLKAPIEAACTEFGLRVGVAIPNPRVAAAPSQPTSTAGSAKERSPRVSCLRR